MPIIISNYANDIIEYKNNSIIEGGPALYIEEYYKSNNIKYKLFIGESKGEVLILNNNGDDIGLIKYAPKIIIKDNIVGDYFIISTLLNEFNLINTNKLNGLIFCDIQGYIRELNSTNRVLLNKLEGLNNVDFLKVADYEFQYLTNNLIYNFVKKGGTVIITTGSKGIIKLINNQGEKIINIPIGNFSDTIGAGDTFLSVFANYYYQFRDLEKAIVFAGDYVYNFLKKKNNI